MISKNLNPADFEDLTRDLVGAELKIPIEGFGPGSDGGKDGGHWRTIAASFFKPSAKQSQFFFPTNGYEKGRNKIVIISKTDQGPPI